MSATAFKIWQGDRHLLRLNIDEVDNGVSTGDLNLSNIVTFSYSIGTPSGPILVNRTYTKAEVLDGLDASGNVLIPIVGGDTASVTPGFYTFQVWMLDDDGFEYTVFEREIEIRDKLKT
ncbi:MAG: hypothetical protein E6Q97_12700 [Desulfurellales bacterium]|nr:MAG: hypothetical protein E6Q97_12700 [Desulfurellales bacterium]